MSRLPSIFFSNRIEVLYRQLKKALFADSHPFAKRIVIVPSPAMKSWLQCQMAQDAEMGIAAGMEVGFIDETLDTLIDFLFPDLFLEGGRGKKPQELEICLVLEKEMRAIVHAYPLMSAEEQSLWQPLLAYLGADDKCAPSSTLHKKSAKRILSLASTLGSLFVQYGRLGGRLIQSWAESNFLGGWQEQLWKKLENFFYPWNYPSRKFDSVSWDPFPNTGGLQVHLFGLSYLAPLHHRVLMKLSSYVPLNYYIVSPCQKFWSDILSNKESVKLKGYWQRREASQGQQLALEEYLRDNNPLLANFGRLGREMALQIESSQAVVFEQYVLSDSIEAHNAYSHIVDGDVHLHPSRTPLTILEAVQSDMALLRNPEETCSLEFEAYDRTIQLHAAPKRVREIQVIYDALMEIIEKHRLDEDPITPGDIIVMSPDVQEYAPFIESVFHAPDSAISAQVMDIKIPAENRFIQGFLYLLQLAFTRWDAVSLLRLFDYSSFQRRHKLTNEDAAAFKNWIKSAGIRWGKDSIHRNELLKRDHCPRGMFEESWMGTWEHGLGRLLEGLAMISDEGSASNDEGTFVPLEGIEPAQGELLGKLVLLLRSLMEDLKPLHDDTLLTLTEWSAYLRCLCEAYFSAGIDDEDLEGISVLIHHIDMFGRVAVPFGLEPYAFSTIYRHLESALQNRTSDHRETNLNAVRFCSLLPMRAVPAKVIVLMGMQDGAFPRVEEHFSFNLLLNSPHADYFPAQVDFDRYLFLESLLSARKYFLISCISQAPGDSKEQLPSLLATELLAYLDKAYKLPKGKMSEACHFKHPRLPFDKSYFSTDAIFRGYSQSNYAAAKAFCRLEKKPRHIFLPDFPFYPPYLHKGQDDGVVNLSDLAAFAKSPLKTYFNKTLGIYLDNEEMRMFKCEEEMELLPLDAAILSRQGLFVHATRLLKRAEMTGRLPRGPFKKIGAEKIMRDLDALQAGLQKLGVAAGQLFSIEFSGRYLKNKIGSPVWFVPQLEMETPQGRKVKIAGKFEAVCAQGLIVFADSRMEEAIKTWPEALAFSCLVAEYALPIDSKVIFAKGSKVISKSALFSSPKQELGQYLDYYFNSRINASPLLPSWVESVMAGDAGKLEDSFKKGAADPFQPIYDQYLKWLYRTSLELDFSSAAGGWQTLAKELFAVLTAEWFSRAVPVPVGQSEECDEVI